MENHLQDHYDCVDEANDHCRPHQRALLIATVILLGLEYREHIERVTTFGEENEQIDACERVRPDLIAQNKPKLCFFERTPKELKSCGNCYHINPVFVTAVGPFSI